MRAPKELIIAGEAIGPGDTRDLSLSSGESYTGQTVRVPIRVIRAERDGPVVFLTGAVHGDELNGTGIIRQLLFDPPPDLIRGTLVCLPVVNVTGLESFSRYLPDRRDLNRCFPGSASGSMSSRLARALYDGVLSQCDFGIDLHSAAVRRTNYPNLRADLEIPAVRRLARAFGAQIVVQSTPPKGSLRGAACAAGAATIVFEAGEVWKIEPSVTRAGVRGCRNVFRALKMIAGPIPPPPPQVFVRKTKWVRAERGGLLSFHARPGQLVEKGEPIATNYGLFGREQNVLESPVSGMVLGMTTMPAVKPGEPVYHIASLTAQQRAIIEKEIASGGDVHDHERTCAELATNVLIEPRKKPTDG